MTATAAGEAAAAASKATHSATSESAHATTNEPTAAYKSAATYESTAITEAVSSESVAAAIPTRPPASPIAKSEIGIVIRVTVSIGISVVVGIRVRVIAVRIRRNRVARSDRHAKADHSSPGRSGIRQDQQHSECEHQKSHSPEHFYLL
jgi:sensor c-di-GMP phosphodiesterase-like protein